MPKKYKINRSFTHDGVRYYIHADTEEEFYTRKANLIRDLDEGKVVLASTMTVRAWTEQCLTTYKVGVKPETLRDMKLRIDKHIISEIGSLQLKQVKPLHCQKIMSNQEGMSKSHVDKLFMELNFIFEKAVENELISKNPAARIEKPIATQGSRRKLTDHERDHFLSVCDNVPAFTLFLLMYYCGCRPSEAAGAIGKDIEMIDGVRMLHIRGTKSKNSDRYVPIPNPMYDRVAGVGAFELLAPNNAGHMHTESSYKRLTARLKREMNISMGCKVYRNQLLPPFPLADDFVPYCLRHTYCTNLCKAGVDVRKAQKLMGHSSISITANIYTHVDKSDIASVSSVINAFLSAQKIG